MATPPRDCFTKTVLKETHKELFCQGSDMTYRQNCVRCRYIHAAVRLATSPQLLPQRVLHGVRSSASSFNFQYSLVSLWQSSICVRLLPRLPVTFIFPFISPSITCSRRQFIRKRRPITFVVLVFIVCRIFRYGTKQTAAINETEQNKDCKRNKYPRQKRCYCRLTTCVQI